MKYCLLLTHLAITVGYAQYAGHAGTIGSTAIHKDSSAFVAWAKTCTVQRGYQDISNPSLGYASVGDSSKAIGKADGIGVVSLGDGGMAILTFSTPIVDGSGYDFAVFENSFDGMFLELAFVEVSSDGIHFFRFPATSNSQDTMQYDNAAVMDCSKLNNLAGKYIVNYGTPFDLQELSGIPGLDINHITHIKIIDVVGSLNPTYARYDSNHHVINDPWTTPYPSCGFDLDAVGVIHQDVAGISEWQNNISLNIYPNPFSDIITINNTSENNLSIDISLLDGRSVMQFTVNRTDKQTITTTEWQAGTYIVSVTSSNKKQIFLIIKQ